VKIHVLPSGPILTIGYLLTEPKTGGAVLVDAPGGILARVQPVLTAERCQLQELWITHGHWDHTQDAAKVKRETGARVRAHRADQVLIETPAVMEEFLMDGIRLEPVTIDEFVEQGQRFTVLGREVEVRHVPGHCPGNVLYYLAAAKAAFVGDALFAGSVGRTDLPGGDFATLERSIRGQIYTLPDDTAVLPGHGPRTTVGDEKAGNPFVPAEAGDTGRPAGDE
jgi:glyoxylase-like metal-dependent hydrolase (beta-lactamase superfamily II)